MEIQQIALYIRWMTRRMTRTSLWTTLRTTRTTLWMTRTTPG